MAKAPKSLQNYNAKTEKQNKKYSVEKKEEEE